MKKITPNVKALLFWESRYLDLADECKDLIFFDKKQE